MGNSTCFTEHAPFEGPPLIQNGQLTFQAHHVGWMISGFFAIVATMASFWLIGKHLMWYTNKRQQRYIVRLLLMVPLYATASFISYLRWKDAIIIALIRDSYESFVLHSFFYLLLQYLSPTTEGQKEIFRNVSLKNWVFPMGFVKYRPRDGLYFLQLMKWAVLQYCILRPTTTLAACILDSIGLYCEASWSPGWGHIYITVIVSLSVTVAMYCLIQLYVSISEQLAPHKPLLKLFSVKAVVFLTFWQATGLSILAIFGVVKDTNYMTAEDINTGIGAILETFEMMCFAFLHIRAFSYIPYRPKNHKPSDQTPRFRSFLHAIDLRDMWREIRDGSVYMGRTIRGVEAEEEARRRIHFAKVMGREREISEVKKHIKDSWTVGEEGLLLDEQDRRRGRSRRDMWLSEPGDRLGGAFEDEVHRELQRRDLWAKEYDLEDLPQGHTRGQTSWWRGLYDRLSQTVPVPDREREERLSPDPRRPSHDHCSRARRYRSGGSDLPSLDSPPPSAAVMYEYSTPGNGRSSVRLSHSHKRSSDTRDHHDIFHDRVKHGLGHHYHACESNSPGMPYENYTAAELQSPAQTGKIAAPHPMPASQSHDIGLLVSGEGGPHSVEIQSSVNDHDSAAPIGVVRSDSLLARVFPNSTPNTVDGHASSEGRTNPASSQDTLPTPTAYSWAPSPSVVNLASSGPFLTPQLSSSIAFHGGTRVQSSRSPPTRNREPHSGSAASRPKRGHPRPNIVLPTPLSPIRHPVEPPRRGPPLQTTRHASGPSQQPLHLGQIPAPLARVPRHDPNSIPSGSRTHDESDRRGSSRRHSTQFENSLIRQPRASKRLTAPVDGARDLRPTSLGAGPEIIPDSLYAVQTAEGHSILPAWSISPDLSGFASSPTGSGPEASLTIPPSSPSRPLRHSRGNIGRGKRS